MSLKDKKNGVWEVKEESHTTHDFVFYASRYCLFDTEQVRASVKMHHSGIQMNCVFIMTRLANKARHICLTIVPQHVHIITNVHRATSSINTRHILCRCIVTYLWKKRKVWSQLNGTDISCIWPTLIPTSKKTSDYTISKNNASLDLDHNHNWEYVLIRPSCKQRSP